jgi:iron complex outermembrane receptor protein
MVAFNINTVFGQNTFKAVIKDSETKEPLIGATAILSGTATGATADINGMITLTNIPNGKQIIEFRYIGYETCFITDVTKFNYLLSVWDIG